MESELRERVEKLEHPYRAMSKAVADGVLTALKESGLAIPMHEIRGSAVTPQVVNAEVAGKLQQAVPELPGVCAIIGALSPGTLVNEQALAKILNRTPRTIRRAVQRGELPPPIPLAGNSTWTVGAVLQHLNKRLEVAARKQERHQQRIEGLLGRAAD
jgi:hypothetical protein